MVDAQAVAALRQEMAVKGLSGFIIPSGDAYMSEYVPEHDQRLQWLTGFDGSAGSAVILEDKAAFFTDGRYMIQARNQLDLQQFELHNIAEKKPVHWIMEHASGRVGYDPMLHTVAQRRGWEATAPNVSWCPQTDNLVDAVWKDRPAMQHSFIEAHDVRFAGETAFCKRGRLNQQLKDVNVGALLMCAPDAICWLLNIRGRDVENTPLVFCRAWFEASDTVAEGGVTLFIEPERVNAELQEQLGENTHIKPLAEIELFLSRADERVSRVVLDVNETPAAYVSAMRDCNALQRVEMSNPCQLMKACKNPVEIKGAQEAHRIDGAALTHFLHWLATTDVQEMDELKAAQKLHQFRSRNEAFIEPSFDTISGFGEHGAVVHYRVTSESALAFEKDALYLVDSGGQYRQGTTDVTRTLLFGEATDDMREHYTRVLKGHVQLAMAHFPVGTTGGQLDALARQPLWEVGLEYDHGTGHGVGSFLGVHEGPQGISKRRSDVALQAGMILSNEPGYYREGQYGIRIENLMHVVKRNDIYFERPFLGFETLTMAPYERALIVPKLLSHDELNWVNKYHALVLATLSPLLEAPVREWLQEMVRPIG